MDYLLHLEKIIDTVGLYVGTVLIGFVSGLVPLINWAEIPFSAAGSLFSDSLLMFIGIPKLT